MLEDLILYINRVIFDFVMYYIYGESGPSLLIESMIYNIQGVSSLTRLHTTLDPKEEYNY